MVMRYLSVCSGIEAASVAWEPLGWEPVAFSEIDPFASAVLATRFPHVPNFGDLEQHEAWNIEPGSIGVLVGGTPCQSFSIAGLRGGIEDARGNLALVYARMARKLRPRWVIWENVPGVLSAGDGRDFGSIVGALVECGYSLAWRVLDAQHFGVPQRRRRLFLVGYLGSGTRAAEVLFEPSSVRRNLAPRREARKEAPASVAGCAGGIAKTLTAGGYRLDAETETLLPLPFDTSQVTNSMNRSNPQHGDPPAIAFHVTQDPISGSVSPCLSREPSGAIGVATASTVRRLTPRECERLQGFPDDWTLVPRRGKLAADGPRYKALGNSMAVPVMRWLGERIQTVQLSHPAG